MIDNEKAHEGDLLNEDGTAQDDEKQDGKNTSDLYNLIFNRVGRPQAICDTDDPTYQSYFKNHPDQYVNQPNTYNFYFYYKPSNFTLKLYLNPSTEYGTEIETFYGKKLSELTLPGKATAGLPGESVMKSYAPAGYSFAGWATSPFQSKPSATIADNFTMPAYNLTLYAIWEPVQYTVTTWGVDANGHVTTDTDLSATSTGSYGQKLRELRIPNPQKSKSLFQYWKQKGTDTPVTGMHILKSDLTIEPVFTSLTPHTVTYHNQKVGETLTITGNVPTDNNQYIEGAKAVILDGTGLTATRKDIDGTDYQATFTCWEDENGNRYYPNDSYTMTDADLKLYAVYSEYRETKLIYHTNDIDQFANEDETTPFSGTVENGTIVVRFLDMLRPGFDPAHGGMIPNHQFTIGMDQNGTPFTVTRTDGKQLALAGWSTEPGGPVVARNGDRVYANTLMENGKLKNELWPVWGICKVVDNAHKKERVFEKIQDAVDFINNSDASLLDAAKTDKVEMLVDYEMSSTTETQVTIPNGAKVTLSTAGQRDTASEEWEKLFYSGTGTETGGDGRGIIQRASNNTTDSLFVVESGGSFTTEKIVFDGGATLYPDTKWTNTDWGCTGAVSVSGGLIHSDGDVTVGAKSTLQNSAVKDKDHHGGAVYVGSGGKFDIQGEITHCISIKGHGGGAYVADAVDLSGTDSSHKAKVSYCKAADGKQNTNGSNGGGIYIGNGAKATVKNISFDHCVACGGGNHDGGAGLYVTSTECTVQYCDFEVCESSYKNAAGLFHYNEEKNAVTTVEHCTFDKCKAVSNNGSNGNSGGAMEADARNVFIRYATFTDCESRVNGGAINVWNDAKEANVEVSNCSFENCKARTSLGGALRNRGKNTDITNCTFKGCSANKGGGVCSDTPGGSLTISGASTRFEGCTATTSGGGIYLEGDAGSKLDFSDGTIDTCEAPNGGGVYLTNGTFNFESGTISGSKSTTAHGGGVYLNSGTFNLKGGTISGCQAEKRGGGIFQNDGTFNLNSGAIENSIATTDRGGGVYLTNGTFNLKGGTIKNCKSLSNGGGAYLGGGSFTQSGGTIENCYATKGGGACIGGSNTTVSITKAGEAIFNCYAKTVVATNSDFVPADSYVNGNQGGGIYQEDGTFSITNALASIHDCGAYDGGGIYLNGSNSKLKLGEKDNETGGKVYSCTAEKNGGGIYQNNGTLDIYNGTHIYKNTANNYGGGIFLGGGQFTLHGGTVGGISESTTLDETKYADANHAKNGGGLFVKDNATAYIHGGGITYNTASSMGGGIAVGGTKVKLYFGGNIEVWFNQFKNSGSNNGKYCNVALDRDSNAIINTHTDKLLEASSHIGVYVPDKANNINDLFKKHGDWGKPFGTYEVDSDENLNRFINDRTENYAFYYGVAHPKDKNTTRYIYWADYVCKITDKYGNLLFENQDQTAPGLYLYLGKHGAFDALGKRTFYDADGKPATPANVEMLVQDYDILWDESVNVPTAPIKLKTASEHVNGTTSHFITSEEGHIDYRGTSGTYCTISRGSFMGTMFTTAVGSNLTLENITIDGGATYNDTGEPVNTVNLTGGMIETKGDLTMNANSILQNSCAGNGGAVSCAGNGTFAFTMNLGSKIQKCYATNGGALYVNAGGGKVTFKNGGQILTCSAQNGGGVYVTAGELTLNGNINDCTATNGGGVYVNGGKLNLSDTSNITGGTATYGGGAYVNGGTLNLVGKITGGKATNGGGGAYVNGGTLNLVGKITGGTATNGGGVYLNGGTLEMKNTTAEISGNSAQKGAGVFANPGEGTAKSLLDMWAGSITGNHASNVGGGIAVGGQTNVELRFQGTAKVQDNTMQDPEQPADHTQKVTCNIYLDQDSDEIITTMGLANERTAYIGVYVSDTFYQSHGATGKPFAKNSRSPLINAKNLDLFKSDRDDMLYGVRRLDKDESLVYWVEYVCRITDEAGNLLTVQATGKPAVYAELSDAVNDYAKYQNSSSNVFTWNNTSAKPAQIQMLVDSYTMFDRVNKNLNVPLKLTTAPVPGEGNTETYVFHSDSGKTKCTIIKAKDFTKTYAMFKIFGSTNLTFTNIALDGNRDNNQSATGTGCLFEALGNAKVTLDTGTELQNAVVSGENGKGGAFAVKDNGEVTMKDGVSVSNCASLDACGGAVYLEGNGVFNMEGGSISDCTAASDGGAIYVGEKTTSHKNGVTFNLSGGSITGNRATKGAGIYATKGSTVKLSGGIDFGGTGVNSSDNLDFTDCNICTGNAVSDAEMEATANNGGKQYPITDTANSKRYARQDIYLAGGETEEPLDTLHVTDNLTGKEGSIWVWAEQAKHYQKDMQFAKLDKTGITGLKVFRNARHDKLTADEDSLSEYLTGVLSDSDSTQKLVYWGVSVKGFSRVILKKVGSSHEPLNGAQFELYRGDVKIAWPDLLDSSNNPVYEVSSETSGVFYIGTMNLDTYYIKETDAPSGYSGNKDKWFCLIVDDAGVWMSDRGYTEAEHYQSDTTKPSGKDAAKLNAEAVKADATT